jgi:hypothetical protein
MLGSQVPMELVTSVAGMVTLHKTVQRKANKGQQSHNKRLFNVIIVGNGATHEIGVLSYSQNCARRRVETANKRSNLAMVVTNKEDQEM